MTRIIQESVAVVVGAEEFGEAVGLLLETESVIVHHAPLDRDAYRAMHTRVTPAMTIIDCVTTGNGGHDFLWWLRLESGIAPHPVILIVDDEPEDPLHPSVLAAPVEYVRTPVRHHVLVEIFKRLVPRPVREKMPMRGSPAAAASATPPASAPAPAPPPTRAAPEAVLGRPRVMVVDDEPQHSQLLAEFLDQGGFEALQVPAPRVFEAALLQKPHLIVMDINMPVIDGLTLTGVLKFCHLTRHIPVVMLTAHSESRFVEGAKNARASAFIPKPVRGSQFLATIREVLSRTSG